MRSRITLVVGLLLCLCACSSKKSIEKPIRTANKCIVYCNFGSYTDEGKIYVTDDHIIHYVDYTSGEDVILCSKNNCAHKNSSICEAYIPEKADGIIQYNHKMYIICVDDDWQSSTILCRDYIGSEWNAVGTIPYCVTYVLGTEIDGKFYGSANKNNKSYEEMMEDIEENHGGLDLKPIIVEIDLEQGTCKELTDSEKEYSSCYLNTVSNQEVTFVYEIEDMDLIMAYDRGTMQVSSIASLDKNKVFIEGNKECYFYQHDGNLHVVRGQKDEILLSAKQYLVHRWNEGYLVWAKDNENAKEAYYQYDEESGELVPYRKAKTKPFLCLIDDYGILSEDDSAVNIVKYLGK